MIHYQRLGVSINASRKDIKLAYLFMLETTDPENSVALADINTAYQILSNGIQRRIYDDQIEAEAEGLALQNRLFPKERKFRLQQEPDRLNHYDYINRLFALNPGDADYLIPGQPIGRWDRNRLYWQLHTISGKLHDVSEELGSVYSQTLRQQKRLELLQRNEEKIALCIFVLTTGHHERCLYDVALGSVINQPNEDMQDIAYLIGGWEQMAAYLKRNPKLHSADAIFALRKAEFLTPANFNWLMASANNERQLGYVANVINQLTDENLLNQANFEQVIAHSQFALSLDNGLSDLAVFDLLDQQSFEALLEAGQYAEVIGSGWKILKELNLLNQANQEMVSCCAANDIDLLILKSFRYFEEQQLFTPDDGLDFLWTGETEELQTLSLHIDEMFAYGISLLCHDKHKAETVFLFAIDLKKSLKNHFSKPLEEQQQTEQQFKREFKRQLHSQDTAMAEHRAYWQVIIANIALAFTGIGLLALGAYSLKTGRLFFDKTHREQLRDGIEESPWLLENTRISV